MNKSKNAPYLLLGPETGKKSAFIKKLYAKAREDWGDDVELHRFYSFELESGKLLSMLQNNSLFAEHQVFILAQVENLQQGPQSELLSYLAHPSDAITLIMTSSEIRVHKKIMDAVPKANQIIFWELFENQKQDWLKGYFRHHSMRIDDETISLILDLVENNTQEMKLVCDQLVSYLRTRKLGKGAGKNNTQIEKAGISDIITITEEDVEQFIYHSRKENVFSLFKKMAARDLRGSLEIYRSLYLAGEAYPVQLIAGLLWQFRRLHSYVQHLKNRFSSEEAQKKVKVLGKTAAIRGKGNQAMYAQAAANYSLRDIRSCIVLLQRYDIQVRSVRNDLESTVMELLLYRIIVRSGEKTIQGNQLFGLIGLNYPPLQNLSLSGGMGSENHINSI
ncbi:MAG: DNA polymerase III subunit delta [Spirochaetales bacterium]|nr:DNA polymerase III subunit delta [Spirochaetales bacterium]